MAIATFNNGLGAAGVAQHSALMALSGSANRNWQKHADQITTSSAVRLIDAARYNKANVLNISWGSMDTGELDCSSHKSVLDTVDRATYNAIQAFPGIVTISTGNQREK